MASPEKVRALPNVLITGTPGTGKTLTASQVVERTGMSHFNVSELAKEGGLYEGWDEQFQSYILDEDKVVDELNDSLVSGGCIVEYHGCDFFPERWFDAIFVLRTDNALLYDRLTKRGYNQDKITNNVQCEIFQTILEEARESYSPDIVNELISNVPEDMERNVDLICQFIADWQTKKMIMNN